MWHSSQFFSDEFPCWGGRGGFVATFAAIIARKVALCKSIVYTTTNLHYVEPLFLAMYVVVKKKRDDKGKRREGKGGGGIVADGSKAEKRGGGVSCTDH